MSVRRGPSEAPPEPPLANQHPVPSSIPAWRRPHATAQPIPEDELFQRKTPWLGDFVREMKLNQPFLVANGIDPEAVAELASVNLQEMYRTLMGGGGFLSLNRSLKANAKGGIVPFTKATVHKIEDELTALPIDESVPIQVDRLWWDTLHAERALEIIEEKIKSYTVASQYFATPGPATFASSHLKEHLKQWQKGFETKRMRYRVVVGETERDVTKFGDFVAGNNVLEDMDWVEVDKDDPSTWIINGQAIAIEILLSLLAARVGVHVPIACCGSDKTLSRFWILQCDYERTLDEMMSPKWCELRSKLIYGETTVAAENKAYEIEQLVLTHAVRMVRLLSRMGILVLRLDPRRNIAASVSGKLPVQATVALTDMRADHCQLVDLGDEFCQWYMECFLFVALAGPMRQVGGERPYSPYSLLFFRAIVGSDPGAQAFDSTLQTEALKSELVKCWKAAGLSNSEKPGSGSPSPTDDSSEPNPTDDSSEPNPTPSTPWEPDQSKQPTFAVSMTEHSELVKLNDKKSLPRAGEVPPQERITVSEVQDVVNSFAPETKRVAKPSFGNLLSEIQAGRTLRRTESTNRKPVQKSRHDDAAPESTKPAGESIVDTLARGLAMRRGAMADSDDSDTEGKYGHFPGVYFRPPARRHGVATDAPAGAAGGANISLDSQKFAKTMHDCVFDLAKKYVEYWWPSFANGSKEEIVRMAVYPGHKKDVHNALDLLEHMLKATYRFAPTTTYAPNVSAIVQPVLSRQL